MSEKEKEESSPMCGTFGLICGHLCAMLCCETCCLCLVPRDVPFLPSHLSVVFLDELLKRPSGKDNKPVLTSDQSVISVEAKLFGTGDGLLSQMYRLNMTYSPSGAGPKTIVAKLSPPNPKARLTGSILSLFKYEHEFYSRNVAHKIGLHVPRCYYSGLGDYGRYCLLLEDFAPAAPADQLKGLSKSEVAETISQISKLHAKYRGRVVEASELKKWVLRQNDDFYYTAVLKELRKKASAVEAVMTGDLQLKPKQFQDMMNVVNWLVTNGDLYLRFVCNSFKRVNKNMFPSTLVHGDLRGENILFAQQHMDEFMLFDFQLMKELNGVNDIEYLIASSMTVSERRKHERDLLVLYYNEMKKRGASDLTWEELLLTYPMAHTVLAIVTCFAVVDNITGEGKNDPKTRAISIEYVLRTNAACEDWNVMASLNYIPKKLHEDNTIDRMTYKEQLEVVPEIYCDLLEGGGTSITSSKNDDDDGDDGASDVKDVVLNTK